MSMTVEPSTVREVPNGRCGSFSVAWQRYDRMLGDHGRRAIAAAEVTAGERVVDIGCGAGGSTLDAAVVVGPKGRVTGIDVEGRAIDAARGRAASTGSSGVEFIVADAAVVSLDGPVDALISRFGVHLFESPKPAFCNLAKMLSDGGRLAVTCWREADRNAWAWVGMKALARVASALPSREAGRGPFALADPRRVVSFLEAAGLSSVGVASLDEPVWVGDDVEEAISFFEQSDAASVLARLSSDQLTTVHEMLRDELAPFTSERGVYVPASAWLVTARANSRGERYK